MFSKTEKTINKKRQWSITFRLAWIYGLSAFIMLVIATFSLYWILAVSLETENFQFLQYKTFVWQKVLQNKFNNLQFNLKEAVILEETLYDYYTRIIDENGTIILETPGMSKDIPRSAFIPIQAKNPNVYQSLRWHSRLNNKTYLLMSSSVLSNEPGRYQFIEVAKDVSTERHLIVTYRRGILIILLLGIVVSASIGILVTREGLRPLRRITETTKQITVSEMKERLDPFSWPTELSELAVAFNNMLDRIEKGFTQLVQFSGDLAHELRTPINNLMNAAEITLSKARSTKEYRESLESIYEEFERLVHMIESLLFLAQAENPKSQLKYSAIEIAPLLKDLQEFYEAFAEEKGVTIEHQGNATVSADPLMLRRVLSNLISNALKHTARGGKIMLSAKTDSKRHSIITVEDTGSGIPPDSLPHLFNRFYRVDSARAQETGGTGLGLAIVKSIMDLHQGKVSIDSELGRWTKVTLSFPERI